MASEPVWGDTEAKSSAWFPDWETGSFDVSIFPLLAFQTTSSKDDSGETLTTSAFEYGVWAAARNIAVIDQNPGLQFTPYAGIARTEMRTTSSAEDFDAARDSLTRMWGGVAPTFFYHWYRHVLDVGIGKSVYADSDKEDINLLRARNNLGVRMLSGLSLHFQPTYARLYARTWSDDYYYEWDHWAYLMAQASFLDFHFRIGPGKSTLNYRDRTIGENTRLEAEETYALADASFRLFGNLGAEATLKYVFKGVDTLNEAISGIRAPDRSIQERHGYYPDETLHYRVFVGKIVGFGIGVYYDAVSFKDQETKKRTTEDEWGVSVRYQIDVAK